MNIKFTVLHSIISYSGDAPTNASEGMAISIAKWELIVQELVKLKQTGVTDPTELLTGASLTCGMCMLYYSGSCNGCHIADYAGDIYCRNTPYEEYINNDNDIEKAILLAKQEIAFLEDVKHRYNL